jgi:hypothetical protein
MIALHYHSHPNPLVITIPCTNFEHICRGCRWTGMEGHGRCGDDVGDADGKVLVCIRGNSWLHRANDD